MTDILQPKKPTLKTIMAAMQWHLMLPLFLAVFTVVLVVPALGTQPIIELFAYAIGGAIITCLLLTSIEYLYRYRTYVHAVRNNESERQP